MTKYNFDKAVDLPFDKAIERVTEELKKKGFVVLTEVDSLVAMSRVENPDLDPVAKEVQAKVQRVIENLYAPHCTLDLKTVSETTCPETVFLSLKTRLARQRQLPRFPSLRSTMNKERVCIFCLPDRGKWIAA